MLDNARMKELTNGLPTKSAKIRALSEAGCSRADIARFLGIRYQHVRNVLVQSGQPSPCGATEPETPGASGLAEEQAHFGDAPAMVAAAPDGIRHRVSLKLDAGGRVLIPAAMREAMQVGEGDTVLAWLEDGELHLVTPRVALRQAQALARRLMPDAGSLADELIAERREEARREDGREGSGRGAADG